MDRLINRRQQGDLGEASAIEWLTALGATVFTPMGHSPDVDLVAHLSDRWLRVQVKTSVRRQLTPNGDERYSIHLATMGGNQSWSGTVKTLDADSIDFLFVLTGDGRRWFIPAPELEGKRGLTLGGARYSEFEINPGRALQECVYGIVNQPLESKTSRGSVGVWRAERDCKFRALALSEFESHLPHSTASAPANPYPTVERRSRSRGVTRVSKNHQVTIPRRAFRGANLAVGDRLRAEAISDGEVVFRRIAQEHKRPRDD